MNNSGKEIFFRRVGMLIRELNFSLVNKWAVSFLNLVVRNPGEGVKMDSRPCLRRDKPKTAGMTFQIQELLK